MAGHPEWVNIKHRKERQDAKRDKVFTKLIRELIIVARQGGGVLTDNPHLRLAVGKALTANMTRDTIDRAIACDVDSSNADSMVGLPCEGYAPSGVAIIVEVMTDSRNRTVAEVRHAFSKCGGSPGIDGSIVYMFEYKGQISFAPGVDKEAPMDAILGAGADDVVISDDGSIDVFTTFTDFVSVDETPAAAGFESDEAEVIMAPSTTVTLDLEAAQKVFKLTDILEDLDDVQNVYSNADTPGDVMARLD